ncbi:helix-turn-helix domain-containing protein [Solimonas sp. SE-A11]|uniref:helix-turn-helix domain-containing protein n=1 Tax=Solimonas sp. SE-A11 TaxID=3054954 RepID=UPI00259CE9F0|nr:helix-turn-helix transcriptional regulator [Solimonas sp. SE-A11]MDM4772853.1 helix-turn-helix transcriptional regulator [Solimonas sp. SE-A11]
MKRGPQRTPAKISVGRQIKRLRVSMGYSQEKLAELAGLSQVSVSAIERGVTATNLDVLDRLALALHRETADFFAMPE